MFARVAGFPAIKTLDQYDFSFATGAPREQIMELASLAFVERRLRAFKHLRRIKIPARIISISSILQGEFLENELRQGFSLSERVALTIALAAEETSRQGQRTSSAIAKEVAKPITRAVAKAGWGSDDNFYRAKKVVDRLDAGDAIAELRDAMDAGAVALYKAAELAALPMSKQRRADEGDWSNVDSVLKETRRNERVGAIVKETCTPQGKFNLIYADPPYRFESTLSECRAIENHYPTMAHDEIWNLDIVSQIRAADAILLLWSPAAKLKEAIAVIEAWGFVCRTCAVWDKVNMGMGYYFRLQHEHLLIATRGEMPVPPEPLRPPSIFRSARRGNSEKPDCVAALIETHYPEFRKIELFARKARKEWTAWGFEAPALLECDERGRVAMGGRTAPGKVRAGHGRGQRATKNPTATPDSTS